MNTPNRGEATPGPGEFGLAWPERCIFSRWQTLISVVVYSGLAVAIMYPVVGSGYPFAFDMAFGPQMHVPAEAYGLGADFGRRLPVYIALAGLSQIASPALLAKVILLGIPFLGGLGMHRLAPVRIEAARYFAGFLYAVNPFVYERLVAGHWHILLGYAILPWALPALIGWARQPSKLSLLRAAFWLGVIGTISFAVAIIAAAIGLSAALVLRRESIGRRLQAMAGLAALFAVTNATWIVAALVRFNDISRFGQLDFRSFLVRGSSSSAATANLLRLTGFFRDDFRSPSLATPAGLILFVVIAGLAGIGFLAAWRSGRLGDRMTAFLVGAFVAACLLALGERAPLIGPLLGWLYPRIAGMQVFRESQKFAGLLVLIYAIFGSLGAEAVLSPVRAARAPDGDSTSRGELSTGVAFSAEPPVSTARSHFARLGSIAMAVAIVSIPLAWTPSIFGGASGRIVVAEYPAGWYEANRVLAETGPGRTLVLPWHSHMQFGFIGRSNLNPASDFFEMPLVQAEAIEFPEYRLGGDEAVDRYVRAAIAAGGEEQDFGATVAPLGVDTIVLLKEADWHSYGFLDRQSDLVKVVDNESVSVYLAPGPPASLERLETSAPGSGAPGSGAPGSSAPGSSAPGFGAPGSSAPGSGAHDAGAEVLPREPLTVGYLDATPSASGPGVGPCVDAPGAVLRESPYSYRLPGAGCWLIPERPSDGWVPGHIVASADSGVAMAARTGGSQTLTYQPALVAIGGHMLSAFSIGLFGVLIVWRRIRVRPAPRAPRL